MWKIAPHHLVSASIDSPWGPPTERGIPKVGQIYKGILLAPVLMLQLFTSPQLTPSIQQHNIHGHCPSIGTVRQPSGSPEPPCSPSPVLSPHDIDPIMVTSETIPTKEEGTPSVQDGSEAGASSVFEILDKKEIERLGRARPECFKTQWSEVAFVLSICMAQILVVCITTPREVPARASVSQGDHPLKPALYRSISFPDSMSLFLQSSRHWKSRKIQQLGPHRHFHSLYHAFYCPWGGFPTCTAVNGSL